MRLCFPSIIVAIVLPLWPVTAVGQERMNDLAQDVPQSPASPTNEDSWYGGPAAVQLTPRMIIHQKAQARAYQRIARLESMKWYGMSAARPRYSATPFMGTPTPRWEMPGGRPSAWTPYQGPQIYILR